MSSPRGHPVLMAGFVAAALAVAPAAGSGSVVVGSKNFEESRLLAEIFAQLLEARTDLTVERRLGLAGTQVCFEALRRGAIDFYPEYTGTGLVSLLGEEATASAPETLERVRREFLARWDLWWIVPLGFENSFELAVPRPLAERLGLATISDLAAVAPALRAGFGHEFVGRADGLPGLERRYGLTFADVRSLQHAIKYGAAAAGRIDVLDVYTTDGRLLSGDLVVLEDDRGLFPPYEAAILARGQALSAHPEVGAVLGLLAGALDAGRMRSLNLRLQEGGEREEEVASSALAALGLIGAASATAGGAPPDSLLDLMWREREDLARRTAEHLSLSGLALFLGVAVAVPMGLLLERSRRLAEPAIRLVGVAQTVPSIALLAFMIPLVGVGTVPAVIALWIYSLLPIVRNTYTGVRDAGPEAVEAATALGMTAGQVLRQIRLPLATPMILAGVRTAAVLTVGTATLAAFIGAGGLGEPIVTGLQLADTRRILSGAIPAAALAVGVDLALAGVERWVRPGG